MFAREGTQRGYGTSNIEYLSVCSVESLAGAGGLTTRIPRAEVSVNDDKVDDMMICGAVAPGIEKLSRITCQIYHLWIIQANGRKPDSEVRPRPRLILRPS